MEGHPAVLAVGRFPELGGAHFVGMEGWVVCCGLDWIGFCRMQGEMFLLVIVLAFVLGG